MKRFYPLTAMIMMVMSLAFTMLLPTVTLADVTPAPSHFANAGCNPEGLVKLDGRNYWTNISGWSGCEADTGRGPDANDIEEVSEPEDPVEPEGPVDLAAK